MLKGKYREYQDPEKVGTISFYGANRWQEIKYTMKGNPYIVHYGRRYHLGEFMRVNHQDFWKKALGMRVDGTFNDSFFSGVAIILSDDGEQAKAFTFIS